MANLKWFIQVKLFCKMMGEKKKKERKPQTNHPEDS